MEDSRTPDRSQISQLRQAQTQAAMLAKRELGNVWSEISDWEPARQRDALLELVPAIIDKYADTSSTAAAEWYERVRSKWISDDFKAQTPTRANDDISKLIRAKAGVLFGDDADPMQMLRFLNGVVDKGVKQGGRDAIRYNAKRDPKKPRYARVPSGAKTCSFCAMLASRGWVYESAETAGAMNKYHSDCDCEIVPSWDKDRPNVEGYDPEKLYADYEKAYKAAGDNPTEEDILHAMRQHAGAYTDAIIPERLRRAPGRPAKFDAEHPFRAFLGDRSFKTAVEGTNPGYATGKPEYTNNCQRCVVAYEMRRRGYAVTSAPIPVDSNGSPIFDDDTVNWAKAFDAEQIGCGTDSGYGTAVKMMKRYGDGSRAVIRVDWIGLPFGHVFIAENIKGKIHFIDPQSGNMDVSSYFGYAMEGKTSIMRTDNAKPTELVRKFCIGD